jgi:Ulp1 family protease
MNEESINVYVDLAQDASTTEDGTVILNTWFFNRLQDKDYDVPTGIEVAKEQAFARLEARLTSLGRKVADVFELTRLIIPINIKNHHWMLGLIDFKKKQIIIFDSERNEGKGQAANGFAELLLVFVGFLGIAVKGVDSSSEWTILWPSWTTEARQTDCYQCGPYICFFLNHLRRGLYSFAMEPSKIQSVRMMIALILATMGMEQRTWSVNDGILNGVVVHAVEHAEVETLENMETSTSRPKRSRKAPTWMDK